MFNESSLIKYDNFIVDFQLGNPGSVDFDFLKIWKLKKILKDQFKFNKLHFYHVHPYSFGTKMSSTDENCLKGFYYAFNYSVNFSIITFLLDIYQIDTYQYRKEEDDFIKILGHKISPLTKQILKNLSLG